MYGNNLQGTFIPPVSMYNPAITNISPMTRSLYSKTPLFKNNPLTKNIGLLKGINYQNILQNVSKTIGVVKDAIPVVKEVKPMIGNMKSMLKIASVFSDVTDANDKKQNNNSYELNEKEMINSNTVIQKENNEPNFFL